MMSKRGRTLHHVEKKRISTGARFGFVAASVFALTAWGFDGMLLWLSSSSLPWLKLLTALPLCLGIGALAGWLAARFNRYWASMLIWFFAGFANAWMALRLPFEGASFVFGWIAPAFRGMETYPFASSLLPWGIWVVLGVGLLFSLVGWGEVRLLPAFTSKEISAGSWAWSLLAVTLLVSSGLALDSWFNRPLRQPIQLVHRVLQTATHQESASSTKTSADRQEQIALQPVEKYIHQDYRLTLGAVNPKDIRQSVVMINWGNVWGNCFIENNEMTSCQLSLDRYVKPLICILAGGMQHECGIQVTSQALEQVTRMVEEIKGTDVQFEIFSQRGAVILVRVLSDSAIEHLCALREQTRITLQQCIARR